jgi:hypothetical protein
VAKDQLHKQYIRIILLIHPLMIFIILNASVLFAGQATLIWDPPNKNADGTPLNDLAGYKVYYGTSSGTYTKVIDIKKVTTYTINNLADGFTYYFAVTTYDESKNESRYSNEVSKKVYKCGDVNNDGVIDVVDALMVTRHDAKFQINKFIPEAADVNCDGVIDVVDALIISRKDVGLTVSQWCCK